MKVLVGHTGIGLEAAIPDLDSRYPGVAFAHCAAPGDALRLIADADVYLGWLDRETFLAARRLKWVQSPSTGVDHFLAIPELVASDVLLTSARGTHGACVAESALAMILAFTRGIGAAILYQKQSAWAPHQIRGRMAELTGSTLGIVGLGVIGRALARRAQAFDLRIVAVDLCLCDRPGYVSELWGPERLRDLLRESDYVVVTVPRTPQTYGLIGAREIALMKPSAILVGVSRGGVIDQQALARALREGRLAAAALDVFEQEPLPVDSELWGLENLVITPHVAGGTQFERRHILDIFRDNLGRFLRGDLPLRNQVDKRRGF